MRNILMLTDCIIPEVFKEYMEPSVSSETRAKLLYRTDQSKCNLDASNYILDSLHGCVSEYDYEGLERKYSESVEVPRQLYDGIWKERVCNYDMYKELLIWASRTWRAHICIIEDNRRPLKAATIRELFRKCNVNDWERISEGCIEHKYTRTRITVITDNEMLSNKLRGGTFHVIVVEGTSPRISQNIREFVSRVTRPDRIIRESKGTLPHLTEVVNTRRIRDLKPPIYDKVKNIIRSNVWIYRDI
jgi:hypothetical protein